MFHSGKNIHLNGSNCVWAMIWEIPNVSAHPNILNEKLKRKYPKNENHCIYKDKKKHFYHRSKKFQAQQSFTMNKMKIFDALLYS